METPARGKSSQPEQRLTMNPPILVDTRDRVGLITLNRPEVLNALNDALMDALGAALDRFDADDGIGCILINGIPRAFAAGADIAEIRGMDYMDAYRSNFITRNWERLRRFRKPVVAAVSGVALGGGCELAMMCDVVIAAENARFGLPEVKIGTLPGAGGTQRLPRAVGKAKAMELVLTGRFMDAREAERSGLVSRVVPDDKLFDEALATASTISGYSLPVLMMLKEAVERAYESPLGEGLLFERRTLHASFALADQKEGMAAFAEKRAPRFIHR
jgi:enoyl-CoA hydratase/cyclohex-1-ene-1-carboxyl-CoA hydratase